MNSIQKTGFAVASVILAFGVGFLFGERSSNTVLSFSNLEGAPVTVDLAAVWKAWGLLEEKFVPATTTKNTTHEDHVWGLIEGLADSYDDPYTVFLPPLKSQSFEEEIRGKFGGVGIEIGFRDNILSVIAPLKGTPGDAAGILSGDLIIEIDGQGTQSMTMDEAIDLIRGDVGTEVVLTIAREGEQEFLTIPVVRDIIEVPTLEHELRDDGVYVISLYNFGGTAVTEMRTALRDFIESDATKLILDLRGNPGGYLEAAVEIASWFLPIGKTVVVEDYGPKRDTMIHRSKGYDIIDDEVEIVILIDGGTASASEILAGALKEHNVGTLIGKKTFGKGSVQELVDVTENTSLKITIARWLTPNGISLSNNGLVPDYEVEITSDDIEAERDPQLDAALEYLNTGAIPEPIVVEEEADEEGETTESTPPSDTD